MAANPQIDVYQEVLTAIVQRFVKLMGARHYAWRTAYMDCVWKMMAP